MPFAVRTLVEDRLVGLLVIKDIMWQARHCSFFIGIGDPTERGRGYGSDAVRVLLRYAFLEMNLNRVGLEVMAYNAEAIHAYEAAGFQQDGRLRAFVYRDGVYYDVLTMSILRAEWEHLYDYPPVKYAE
jgi:RimJ/RimL family protein N-acetyltransferase